MVRKHIIFLGRVQRVGFRYKASHIARAKGLTGWVENEWDGSVTMEVQGSESQIDELLTALQQDRFIIISNMKVSEIPIVENEKYFGVKGY